jgi:hypothetical protein
LTPHSPPWQQLEFKSPHVVHAPFTQPHVDAAVHREAPPLCMQHPPPMQAVSWQQGSPSCPHWVVHT